MDGRVRTVSYNTLGNITVLTMNLDNFYQSLVDLCSLIYPFWEPLKMRYSGTDEEIHANLQNDIAAMADYACWICYNRLRSIAERYAPHVRTMRMNPKAPCSNRMEFPSYISSLIQTIGPLRIEDAAQNCLVLYATTPATMQTFGRTEAHIPADPCYYRLISNLQAVGVRMTPVDFGPHYGAYWPTIMIRDRLQLYDVIGTVHSSHYTNEDIVMALAILHETNRSVFDRITFDVGQVTDADAVNALAAIAAPANIPQGQTANSTGRPTALTFDVNYFGIQPAVAATATNQARPASFFVIGRGTDPIFTCYLAQHITTPESVTLFRHRLTH